MRFSCVPHPLRYQVVSLIRSCPPGKALDECRKDNSSCRTAGVAIWLKTGRSPEQGLLRPRGDAVGSCHWDVVKLGSASQQEETSSHLEGVGAVFLLPLLCVCPSPAWNLVFTTCSGPHIRETWKCGGWHHSLPLPVSGIGVPHHLGSLSFSDPDVPVQASASLQPSWQLHLPFWGMWRLWTHSPWPTGRQSSHCCCTMVPTVPY